jgi:hypothetical protein
MICVVVANRSLVHDVRLFSISEPYCFDEATNLEGWLITGIKVAILDEQMSQVALET